MNQQPHVAFAEIQCGFDGTQHTLFIVQSHFQSIDHHFDVMHLVPIEFHAAFEFNQQTVDSGAHIALLHDGFKQFTVMPLSSFDQRSQKQHALTVVVREDAFEDLFVGKTNHGLARLEAESISRSCINQTQKIVHLGDGAHGRTGILGNRFLLYADDRAQSRDLIHFGSFQSTEKLPGVGGKRFEISTLPFGV